MCSQVLGTKMSEQGKGVIVNMSSDLGLVGPDQRLYEQKGVPLDKQPVKPVTYSVIKHGLIGLTKYLATYWPGKVRCNALCPGGIYTNQSKEFVNKLSNLIPMGKMADINDITIGNIVKTSRTPIKLSNTAHQNDINLISNLLVNQASEILNFLILKLIF